MSNKPETERVALTAKEVRVWPTFEKGESMFPTGYVAEARIAETGGLRYAYGQDREQALGDLQQELEDDLGADVQLPPAIDVPGDPNDTPQVVRFYTWEGPPHTEDPKQRKTHARRARLTSGAVLTVKGLLTPQDAQSALAIQLQAKADQLKDQAFIQVPHSYNPDLKTTGNPDL